VRLGIRRTAALPVLAFLTALLTLLAGGMAAQAATFHPRVGLAMGIEPATVQGIEPAAVEPVDPAAGSSIPVVYHGAL